MTIVEEPDRTAFREAMKSVFEQFQGQFGTGLVQRIIDTKYAMSEDEARRCLTW